MHGFAIERTLCQVKSPGRIDNPAAAAFELIIRQDQRVTEELV